MSPRHPSRATPQDLASLYAETARTPMCIGVVAILDGERLALPSVRAAVERRLQLVPRLRQRLLRPAPGLGRPVWVDDPGFDIADQVRARRLPPDAGEAELLAACEELGRTRLDRSRPLWELWLLPGLAGGRTGVFLRVHHVVADGVAGVGLLAALLDLEPDAPGSCSATRSAGAGGRSPRRAGGWRTRCGRPGGFGPACPRSGSCWARTRRPAPP
jgi:hypothetical protein